MDSVRSEYSEDGLTYGASAASLTFSQTGSYDGRSARSDFLNNYEQKFLQHKAQKKKKKKREATENNQLISVEEKRRADRELARQARKVEMESWMVKPETLKQIERKHKTQSRQRMQSLLQWYPSSMEQNDVQPIFSSGNAMSQVMIEQSENEKEAQAALTVSLQKQLRELQSKLAVVEKYATEQSIHSVSPHKRTASLRKRRIGREQLTPLCEDHNAAKASVRSVSLTTLPHYDRCDMEGMRGMKSPVSLANAKTRNKSVSRSVIGASASLNQLQQYKDDDPADEEEIERFLSHHRHQRKFNQSVHKIQATWRMYLKRRVYLRWIRRRNKYRRKYLDMWILSHRLSRRAQLAVQRRNFLAWKEEVQLAIQLREIELKLYSNAEMQKVLPRLVMNLVFTSFNLQPNSRKAGLAKADYNSGGQNPTGFFFNSAFASMGLRPLDQDVGRVREMKQRHLNARETIVKKIVQHTFLQWKNLHFARKRIAMNAQLCIKRAVRMAFRSRPVWAGEKMQTIFDIWSRWAAFTRCKRQGLPLPLYTQTLPHWEIWLHNYQERQIRKIKASARSPLATVRRYFQRLRIFSAHAIFKRQKMECAKRHFITKTTRSMIREWRAAIAESALRKKIYRNTLAQWYHYAHVKASLRPLKQAVQQNRRLWTFKRSWKVWKGVHVRSSFKRDLNLSRMEQRAWRSKVHRIIYIWMDVKVEVNKWKVFDAWKHFYLKRKLFVAFGVQCERMRRKNLLFGILTAWKAAVWKQEDEYLEDHLKLSAWDAYKEISPLFPMLFYGCYSNAAAIFAGIETNNGRAETDRSRASEGEILPYSLEGIHEFQSILADGSVVEARNAVLLSKHLINAVDELSGNTPLHIAAQLEDSTRRIEILALLLSEGATTWDRPNRHGLTPKQLAPDHDSRFLLEKGIYEFHSANVFQCGYSQGQTVNMLAKDDKGSYKNARVGADDRLMWCLVALMSSELVRNARLPSDLKARAWHSVLREEQWLRQDRIIFASTSEFSPAILRCWAFVHGMKNKICRKKEDLLFDQMRFLEIEYGNLHHTLELTHTSSPCELDGDRISLPEWTIQQQEARNRIAKQLGQYEGYAQFLLSPTLEYKAIERSLIRTFVGVLFSLDFTVDEVLREAFHLEDMCAATENELWRLYNEMRKVEWGLQRAVETDDVGRAKEGSVDTSMLVLFSDEAEMDFFFKKELFIADLETLRLQEQSLDSSQSYANNISIERLYDELEFILTKSQRKLRRMEKKRKALEDQLVEYESAYRSTLFAEMKCVKEICEASMKLERTRLKMTSLLLNHNTHQQVVSRLQAVKTALRDGKVDEAPVFMPSAHFQSVPIASRKAFIKTEYARYACFYQLKTAPSVENYNDNSDKNDNYSCALLRRMHKDAVVLIRFLFVTNLFRCCCCWLAENMVRTELTMQEPQEKVEVHEELIDEKRITMLKRRSSLVNTRKMLETLPRGSLSAEAGYLDVNYMKNIYAASAGLLFETERADIKHMQRQKEQLERLARQTFMEKNPITQQPETPPSHIVNLPVAIVNGVGNGLQVPTRLRNRKKEELRKAMGECQLQRIAREKFLIHEEESENDRIPHSPVDQSMNQLPTIHGLAFEFGNFVTRTASIDIAGSIPASSIELIETNERHVETTSSSDSEFIWKRGTRQNDGHKAPSSDTFASEEEMKAIDTSFRMLTPLREKHRLPQTVAHSTLTELLAREDQVASCSRHASLHTDHDKQLPNKHLDAKSVDVPFQDSMETQVFVEETPISDLVVKERIEEDAHQCVTVKETEANERNDSESMELSQQDSVVERTEAIPAGLQNLPHTSIETLEQYLDRARLKCEANNTNGDFDAIPQDQEQQYPETFINSSVVSENKSSRGTYFAFQSHESTEPVHLNSEETTFLAVKRDEVKVPETLPLTLQPCHPTSTALEIVSVGRGAQIQQQVVLQHFAVPVLKDEPFATRSTQEGVDIDTFTLQGKSMAMSLKKMKPINQLSTKKLNETTSQSQPAGSSSAIALQLPIEDCELVRDVSPIIPSIAITVHTRDTKSDVLPSNSTEVPTSAPTEDVCSATCSSSLLIVGVSSTASIQTLHEAPTKTELEQHAPSIKETDKKHPKAWERSKKRIKRQLPASSSDLILEGAMMPHKRASAIPVTDNATRDASSSLTKEQREQVWRDFTALPFSDGVQNAYAALYPQMHDPAPASITTHAVARKLLRTNSSAVVPHEMAPLQSRSLTDLKSPVSLSTLKHDKKFWSAVEGYRAIGGSILVPLDAKTIQARRRDKARLIYEEFLSSTSCNRLDWLDIYPEELAKVLQNMEAAPKKLFDNLQQTAQLRVSTTLSQQHLI